MSGWRLCLVSCVAALAVSLSCKPSSDGAADGGSGGSGGGEFEPPTACQRFLECAAVVDAQAFGALLETYGPTGSCWEQPDNAQDLCVDACSQGIVTMRMLAPDAPECGECREDDECTGNLGFCGAGYCVACTADEHCAGGAGPMGCVDNACEAVECVTAADCAGARPCGEHECGCASDADCPMETPKCYGRECFQCITDQDCMDMGFAECMIGGECA